MTPSALRVSVILAIVCLLLSSMTYGKIDPQVFSQIKPRSIGPANMSGRIGDIDVVLADPNIIYVGTATGGLWKSTDGGLQWFPVFDQQPASSIGAVKVFQPNPDIVWVGTGEANPRNSVGVGRGIFKSLDGGKTWLNLGLAKTEKISRIILHPTNPDIAYAAALGTTWGENPERGIFKTTDGGKTWNKILYIDQKTGAADLTIAPDNPDKLIAALWEHRRWPWFFKSGGPGSGLFITVDGGKNWKKLTDKDGLPAGDLGRIGVSFAPNAPHIVYAMVEATKNALFKSTDGGYHWRTVNNKDGVNGRPFYYCDIRVNPRYENTVYSLQTSLKVSEDGGTSFRDFTNWGQSHSDYHAMWIHPDGRYMIVGSDGGIVISRDGGKNWRFARNLPIGQFYHISFDMQFPYYVYGGLQDNGSWTGPSALLNERGIYNYHWKRVSGGDGFDTEPDPEKPGCGYAMSQGGSLNYFDSNTGVSKFIQPTESDVKHRYNWNAALALDPFDTTTIYYGSQFVHKSTDKGNSWDIISPDLTTNDPEKQRQFESGGLTLDVTAAENHTTILCIAPSPVKKGVIWVSTDDGCVQVTQDGGKNWSLVSTPLTGTKPDSPKKTRRSKKSKTRVPFGTTAPHIEASKFNPACAFVVFEDHARANWTPYVFMTEDYGNTWKSLVTKDIDGFVHVIEQDHVDKNLLFIGTEFGFYFSLNRGKEWTKWTNGFPTVPVRDLQIHPRDNDLVIGTHGRAIYILDDISFLRGLNQAVLAKKAHLFDVPDATNFRRGSTGSYSTLGNGEFSGQNRYFAADITFYFNPSKEELKKMEEQRKRMSRQLSGAGGNIPPPARGMRGGRPGMPGPGGRRPGSRSMLKIEILDKDGNVITELDRISPQKGINRVSWDFREKGMELSSLMGGSSRSRGRGFRMPGEPVLPGQYSVRLKAFGQEMTHSFTVKADPRYKIDFDAYKKNKKLKKDFEKVIKAYGKVSNGLRDSKKMVKTITAMIPNQDWDRKVKMELMKKAKNLEKKLNELSQILQPESKKQGISDRTASFRSKLFMAFRRFSYPFEPATQATIVSLNKSKALMEDFIGKYNKVFETEVEEFRKSVDKAGFTFFKPYKPLTMEEKEEKVDKKEKKSRRR
jgi:photosystem II stability/assembly factor-like uncharacterized protein